MPAACPCTPDPSALFRLRHKSRLSLRDLARRARLDFRLIAHLEQGLTTVELRRLAAALGVEPSELGAGYRRAR